MKVGELIKKLQKFNPEHDIFVQPDWTAFPCNYDTILDVFKAYRRPTVIINLTSKEAN